MTERPGHEPLLREVLGLAAGETLRLRQLLNGVEGSLFPPAAEAVPKAGRMATGGNGSTLQAIDLVQQSMDDLAAFLAGLSGALEGDERLDLRPALSSLRLREMRAALDPAQRGAAPPQGPARPELF
ncbi:hypothetical protein [Pseudoroseicyclus aestuarii]|uniref:Uncharacterized protein n=1 Tax=Pseudoroseicyclus aestuarii TaxID=1795041 RepID=A0A318SSP7_9RHOB|nr:hypothetical protein [Pseudoroseicyclus aestuarii]PYE84961.1 hypothetical protein DFP88_102766 [Pseudoroseicyclus aestuarii]